MGALIGLMLGCSKRISEAVEIHFFIARSPLISECAPLVHYGQAIRRPDALSGDDRLGSVEALAASPKRGVGEAYM
jgi:hypothetical protein